MTVETFALWIIVIITVIVVIGPYLLGLLFIAGMVLLSLCCVILEIACWVFRIPKLPEDHEFIDR